MNSQTTASRTEPWPSLALIEKLLSEEGLICRGGFHLDPAEEIAGGPGDPGGTSGPGGPGSVEGAGRTLILVGNAGPAMWRRFSLAPEYSAVADPLNRWSERVINGIAERLGAGALYPFGGPPYHPFIAWAKRAECVRESPLGLLVHPEYGLWHAYRGALLFPMALVLPARENRPIPCDACRDKPCLTACPVDAFRPWDAQGYDVAACAAHIGAPDGASCLGGGCLARHACPVGAGYAYGPSQARFHMEAFLKARGGRVEER